MYHLYLYYSYRPIVRGTEEELEKGNQAMGITQLYTKLISIHSKFAEGARVQYSSDIAVGLEFLNFYIFLPVLISPMIMFKNQKTQYFLRIQKLRILKLQVPIVYIFKNTKYVYHVKCWPLVIFA